MSFAQLNPMNWKLFRKPDIKSGAINRPSTAQGIYTDAFADFVPRSVAPRLYEVIREAVPVIDAAIGKCVMLDGVLRIEAETDTMQRQLDDILLSTRVNDHKHGLQAYYSLQGNELYEQGTSLGEIEIASGGRDITLWVADAKGIYFRRNGKKLETWYRPPQPERNYRKDGTEQIERLLRNSWQKNDIVGILKENGYKKLKAGLFDISSIGNEGNSPYGTSKIRSLEFVSKTLATMINSTQLNWDRFGDPSYSLTYKTGNKRVASDYAELTKRKDDLASNLEKALQAKREGKAFDFVNAIGKDDELELKVIGADGQTLDIEAPARFVLEQIVSKFDVAPWMLGFVWGTAERLADKQVDAMIQAAKTRYQDRHPQLRRIMEIGMRARGHTWSPQDWQLTQELPNLKNELEQAQAGFLIAQTKLMESGAITMGGNPPTNDDPDKSKAKVTAAGDIILPTTPFAKKKSCNHPITATKTETYVEDETNLMRLEATATNGLLSAWGKLADDLLDVLQLIDVKTAKAAPSFIFDATTMLQPLLDLEDEFIKSVGGDAAALAASMYRAWVRGIANAADELDADEVIDAVRATHRQALADAALAQVKDTTIAAYHEQIIDVLKEGTYNGQNPKQVAAELRKRFDVNNYQWERLARSEIGAAQVEGKLAQYTAQDIEKYDWIIAAGACPICIGLAQAGPYTVGKGPIPVRDSHPNDRCTVGAHFDG